MKKMNEHHEDLEAAVHAAMTVGIILGLIERGGVRGMTRKQIKKRLNRIWNEIGCPMEAIANITQQYSEVATLEKMLDIGEQEAQS